MGRFGIAELGVILVILLLLFGANKLPQIARAVGESIKEFKKTLVSKEEKGKEEEEKKE